MVKATKAALIRVIKLTQYRNKWRNTLPNTINVRVFLAAYIMVHYTNNAFENVDERNAAVRTSAAELLQEFHHIIGQVDATGTFFGAQTAFIVRLDEFARAFAAWKAENDTTFRPRLRAAIVALLEAQRAIPDTEPEDLPLRTRIANELNRLRPMYIMAEGQDAFDELQQSV